MRHRKVSRRYGRTSSHRIAMFRNLSSAVIRHGLIKTTLAKAKDLRRVVEPLVTLAREDNVSKRRLAFARLRDNEAVTKLFTDLGPRYKARQGGYLRVLKCGYRKGDCAEMAIVEFVEREAK